VTNIPAMKKKISFTISLFILMLIPAYGQNDSIDNEYAVVDTLDNDFGLFTKDEILDLTLRFDITKYKRKKPKEEYLDAILTYHISEADSVNKNIRLKSRGEFRNEYCDFPPIRLNFKKSDFQKEDIKEIGKMKMVTHCRYGNEDYLLKEYLIYKLFNALTDYSFRVRLVRISYINTAKKSKPIESYAFFIEPVEILAERTHIYAVDAISLSQKSMEPEYIDRMAIFNYMIGNTDWSVPNQHNCKIFSQPGSNLGIIVPYDFDYSGFVDASYAIPHESLKIKSVRERLYLGLCRNKDVFLNEIEEFSDKREEFYKIINDFQYLDAKEKKRMIYFLDEFFDQFDNRNTIVKSLQNDCVN
jgi:hypothetical protein